MHWGRPAAPPPERAGAAGFSPRPGAGTELLLHRLTALGLRPVALLRLTDNRSVMVSFSRRRALSVHRAYADAPESVLKAIVRFVAPGTPRDQRKAAEHEILSFRARQPGSPPAPRRRIERPRPEDAALLTRLGGLFQEHNARHFFGSLPDLPIRLSGRMRTRLGHLALDGAGRPTEITISRRHLAAHGWEETAHTLLHEMVHLWQYANGHRVDHGPAFRAKSREVGVHAAAQRWVRRDRHVRTG